MSSMFTRTQCELGTHDRSRSEGVCMRPKELVGYRSGRQWLEQDRGAFVHIGYQ
jgi:hypothetical protein